jgi:hypothetical protein
MQLTQPLADFIYLFVPVSILSLEALLFLCRCLSPQVLNLILE